MSSIAETATVGIATLLIIATIIAIAYISYQIYKEDGWWPIAGILSFPFVAYLVGLLMQSF